MDDRFELPNLNPDFCRKVMKCGAAVCVGWLVAEVFILIAVGPGNNRCPGWMIYSENGAVAPLWFLVALFTAVPAAWLCYMVFRWQHFLQQAIDRMMSDRPSGLFGIRQDPSVMFLVDSNKLCVVVTIGWCLFCAFPLWMIVNSCTDLPLQKMVTDVLHHLREM